MKLKASTCFLIFLLLVVAGATLQSLTFRYAEDKILPLILGSLILLLGAIRVATEVRAGGVKTTVKRESREAAMAPASERQRITPIFGWMLGCFLAIYLLGFLLASPLFLLAYLKRHGVSWLKAVSIAAITTTIVFGLFELVFKIELYRGLFFAWL